jgi:hypothetical protein
MTRGPDSGFRGRGRSCAGTGAGRADPGSSCVGERPLRSLRLAPPPSLGEVGDVDGFGRGEEDPVRPVSSIRDPGHTPTSPSSFWGGGRGMRARRGRLRGRVENPSPARRVIRPLPPAPSPLVPRGEGGEPIALRQGLQRDGGGLAGKRRGGLREGCAPAGARHRRAVHGGGRSAWDPGAPGARRRWQQLYRCLRRAQPGPERSGGTRPKRSAQLRFPLDPRTRLTMD